MYDTADAFESQGHEDAFDSQGYEDASSERMILQSQIRKTPRGSLYSKTPQIATLTPIREEVNQHFLLSLPEKTARPLFVAGQIKTNQPLFLYSQDL